MRALIRLGHLESAPFVTFDTQASGNVSYGVRIGDRRYFVKTAGRIDDPDHTIRVARLRNALLIATSCAHPALLDFSGGVVRSAVGDVGLKAKRPSR